MKSAIACCLEQATIRVCHEIKAYYSGGRIDAFDTDRMTDGVPQPGNLLTNYTLDLSDVNGEGL